MPLNQAFYAETDNAQVKGTLTDKTISAPDAPPTGLLAVGPRVTFNFITDAWNKGNSYSYYDVVQVDGNSYIARQNVPSGIDITNTDYWIHWADPNAQYKELYDVVQTFQSQLDTLKADYQKLISGTTYNDLTTNGFVYKSETE